LIITKFVKNQTVNILRLIFDSINIAYDSLKNNKLRTFLSVLGITIGIFCIISVAATIDSLERSIRENVSTLGSNTIYIQKWPWSFSSDYPWWKYLNRPVPKYQEAEFIRKRTKIADYIVFAASTNRNIEYKNRNYDNAGILIADDDYIKIFPFEIEKGRYFSQIESKTGKNVTVLGYEIAKSLFGDTDPIGKEIKIGGKPLVVIGVTKKQGQSGVNNSMDEIAMVTIEYGKNIFNINSDQLNPFIVVSAKGNITAEELKDELTIIMRSIRRLKPGEEDNFALNQASLISKGLDNIFGIINLAGLIIGGFSILVGGFGIANIMFVSVKERTREIGIQKAIGAKSYLILFQFLTESTFLSFLGGLSGIIFVWILMLIARNLTPLNFVLSLNNIIVGTLLSVVIGIIAGFAPARSAAKLDPIVAMNYV